MSENKVLDGLMGFCVGDALGVPVEGLPREALKEIPVKSMHGGGSYHKPPGTWSDDSSLTFCLAESLCDGYNLRDIADKFIAWLDDGYCTPFGQAFGMGSATYNAINNLKKGIDPTEAGGRDEESNGNGSLMRLIPMAFYLKDKLFEERIKRVHEVSSITHGHPRALIACDIYIELAINLLKGENKITAYEKMKQTMQEYFAKSPYKKELQHFVSIFEIDVAQIREEVIKTSGYVLDTLEAGLWCLLNSNSYSEAVLLAVNLGGDTDTTAAVTGGLAGILYGYEDIPQEWVEQIVKKDYIIELAHRLNNAINP
jgi:ADP-ribosylglycohydrolase